MIQFFIKLLLFFLFHTSFYGMQIYFACSVLSGVIKHNIDWTPH